MFIRKKKNPSGVISVQVIEKKSGRYIVLKTLGSSKDSRVVDQLVVEGQDWINKQRGIAELDFDQEALQYQTILDSITQLKLAGPELVLGAYSIASALIKLRIIYFAGLYFIAFVFPKASLKPLLTSINTTVFIGMRIRFTVTSISCIIGRKDRCNRSAMPIR